MTNKKISDKAKITGKNGQSKRGKIFISATFNNTIITVNTTSVKICDPFIKLSARDNKILTTENGN